MLDDTDREIINKSADELGLPIDHAERIIDMLKKCADFNQRTAQENQRFIDLLNEMTEYLGTIKKPSEVNYEDSKALLNIGNMMGFSQEETMGAMLFSLITAGEKERELVKLYISEITRL